MKIVCSGFKKLVIVLAICFLGVVSYFALFTLSDAADYLKTVIEYPQYMVLLSVLLVGTTIFLLFVYIDKCTDIMLKRLTIIFFGILIIGQIILLISFDVVQITDAYLIRDQALAIASGIDKQIDYESTWYFTRYGNNNFVLLLTIWVYKVLRKIHVNNDGIVFALLNVVLIDLTVYFVYKTIQRLSKKRLAEKVLILCVLNPLNYLLIFWTYTCTYSMPVGAVIVYLAVLIYKKDDRLWVKGCLGGLTGFFLAVGYLLRPTALIPFIAVICCFGLFVQVKRESILKYTVIAICMITVGAGSFLIIQKVNSQYVDENVETFPITHWVMMGLSENGIVNREDNKLTTGYATKEEKVEANLEEISNRIEEYGISGLLNHSIKKLALSWADGSGEYSQRLMQDKKFSRIYQWVAGEKTDFLVLYCQSYRILILVFAFCSVLGQWKKNGNSFLFLFTLIIVGGMSFYIIWEGKAVYSVPFLPFLCVLAADGFECLQRKPCPLKKSAIQKFGYVLMAGTLVMSIGNYWNFVKKTSEWTNRTVYSCEKSVLEYEKSISSEGGEIIQTFYAKKKFNEFDIYCNAAEKDEEGKTVEDCKYGVQLLTEGKLIADFVVDESDITSAGYIKFKCTTQKPQGRQEYSIRIFPLTVGTEDSVEWASCFSKMTDQYDGTYSINGREQIGDLFLRVYERKEGGYMSPKVYFLLIILVLLWETVLLYLVSCCLKRRVRPSSIDDFI